MSRVSGLLPPTPVIPGGPPTLGEVMRLLHTAAAAAAASLLLVTAVPAESRTSTPTAMWGMDEGAQARTMTDASGQQLHGTIGADVVTGLASRAGRGYRFPKVAPDALPVRPGHTVVVPDDWRLDPAWRDYTIELRLRPSGSDGNIVQKGQSRTGGGFWKIELNDGEVTCLFRGPRGTNAVRARGVTIVDGEWHTVRCERTETAVDLWVDGEHVGRKTGHTGRIANNHPVSIGGKQKCDQVRVGCDYFSGDVDWLRIIAS